ncbi:phosphatase PAP2 family protein [Nocardia brasiliensis]|uniref:phosphatase PAP2 family protein n=1 Tax=Nocardia brasiliensis TaxID=37326 RepID=UPI001EEAC26E|nr:phosphatase PAP2 family protein [Nocardia brasiliensis]
MPGSRQDAIPRGVRTLGVAAAGATVTATLPATFPSDGGPTALDRALAAPIHAALDTRPGLAHLLVVPSNGYLLVPLLAIAAGWFAYRRLWRSAVLMLATPALAVALNAWAWKPLWHRPLHDYLAYPSGHTVHLVAIATTFFVLIDSPRARSSTLAIALPALLAAAVGMIGLDYHLPTDIIGGTAAAVAMTLTCCWAARPTRGTPATQHNSH